MNIIGISAYYHDSASCLLKDGKLIAAVQEERFSRKKNDPDFPIMALQYCLRQGKINMSDIDCIAYYEDPVQKLARQVWSGQFKREISAGDSRFDAARPLNEIRNKLGYQGLVKFYDHHRSHAASSFFYSGFEEAAIMTVDGVGEWTTISFGVGKKSEISEFHKVKFPNSIGLLYSTITNYLGFEVNEGEYKVMGLASYGSPKYLEKFDELLQNCCGFDFQLNMLYFNFSEGSKMFTPLLCELFKSAPRNPGEEVTQFHMDLAASLQRSLENFMVGKATTLKQKVQSDNLCLAGGVALNCVANRAILKSGSFKNLFVPPGTNDSGCAIGAATLAAIDLGIVIQIKQMTHAYHGPEFSQQEIQKLLDAAGLRYNNYEGRYDELIRISAELIAEGNVIGWFQGRMEFGPRALGARSILADPRNKDHRRLINAMVKKREAFRPFAPTVIEERASEFFDLDHPSPFMLETCALKSGVELPAITHVDGSARVQTIDRNVNSRYYDLLVQFGSISGYPIVLNTSFNVNKEPIVCSPVDAIRGFIKSNIDALVIGNFIIDRKNNKINEMQIKMLNEDLTETGIAESLYTFI